MKFLILTEFRQSYLTALGQIVYGFGLIEYHLHSLLASMLGDIHLAGNLAYSYQTDKVVEVLKAVFYSKDRTEDETTVFEYLMGRLRTLTDGRNDNFHCQWFFDDENKQANRMKFLKHKHGVIKIQNVKLHVPVQELQILGTDLFAYQDELRIFETVYFINPKLGDIPPEEQLIPKEFHEGLLAKARECMGKKKS